MVSNDREQSRVHLTYPAIVLGLIGYLSYVLFTTPQASGYEVSIYSAYPVSFWASYFALYSLAIAGLLYFNNRLIRFSGLLGLILPNIAVILLPLFRRYLCIDANDTLTHLTYVSRIVVEGRVGLSAGVADPYPLSHLVAAGLYKMEVPLQATVQIVPAMYYACFLVGMYLLSKQLWNNSRRALLVIILASVPALSYHYFYPSQFYLLMLPLLFYLALRKNWAGCVGLIALLTFTHPASPALLVGLLVSIAVAMWLTGSRPQLNSYWFLALCFTTSWLLWLVIIKDQSASALVSYPRSIFNSNFQAETPLTSILQGLKLANLNIWEALLLYLKRYGAIHFIMGLGLLSSLWIVFKWRRESKLNKCLALLCGGYIVLYALSFITPEALLLRRIYPYTLVLAIFPATLLVSKLLLAKRTITVPVLVIVLCAVNFLAVFNLYDSPFNKKPSQQLTQAELDAMDWLLENRVSELKVYDLNRNQGTIAQYLLGYWNYNVENTKGLDATGLPEHFGYTGNSPPIGETMGEDCYLITNEKNIMVSTLVYPEYEDTWLYHPDDYERLYRDPSVELLYDRNGIKIFHIKGEAKE